MSCTHDHSCEDHNCAADWSLYKHINLLKVAALNESIAGSVKYVFKAWDRRLDNSEGFLESNEGDPELLIFIPAVLIFPKGMCKAIYWIDPSPNFPDVGYSNRFTSDVKIKSISVIGGAGGTSPSKMRVFINRDDIDFSDAQSMQPVQEWELAENLQGILEYQTRYSRFQSVGSLTLHFPNNFGAETTQIHYIGLRGEATQLKRDAVTNIVYELYPNPTEHKTNTNVGGPSHVE